MPGANANPAQLPSLSVTREWVVDEIRQAIIEGVLRPGDRLVEREIAERLGVSRSPVREAIRLLTFEGFVVAQSPRRIVVRAFTRRDVDDLYDVREALEVLAVGLAVRNATSEDVHRLRQLLDQTALSVDEDVLHRLGNQFHEMLTEVANNSVLSGMVAPVRGRLRWLLQQNADFARLHAEHTRIVDLIEAKDLDQACNFASDHVRQSRTNALALLFPEDPTGGERETSDVSASTFSRPSKATGAASI